MRVVAADREEGPVEMISIPGLKWSGVEQVICIGIAADATLRILPSFAGGDIQGFSIPEKDQF